MAKSFLSPFQIVISFGLITTAHSELFKSNFQKTNSFYQFSNQYSTLPGLIRGQTAVKKIQRQKKIRILIENSEEATFKNISQELRMLSSSLSDCQSQTLIVRVQVSLFVRNSQLCH